MAKDVTIQLVDVVNAFSGNKALKQSEPLMLRRSDAIKTVTGSTKPSYRLAVSPADNNVIANDSGLSDAVIQFPTVDEVNKVHADLSQGFIDVTVKHCFRFEAYTNSPYNVRPVILSSPDLSALVAGDLAIAPYWAIGSLDQSTYEGFVSREFFSDAGNRNGTSPTTSSPLKGVGFPLYRYDGTGWLPAVFDNSESLKKYRIKVLKDQTYYFQTFPNQISNAFENVHLENYYYLVYMPSSASVEIKRTAQFLKVSQVDARIINFDCGDTTALL